MSETATTHNGNMLRVLSLVLGLLALAGWGAFAYAAMTSGASQRQFQEQMAELKSSQGQLMAERDQAKAETTDLKSGRDQLVAERDEAKAQLSAARDEIAVLHKQLDEAQTKASQTGSVGAPTPSDQPARSPGKPKQKRR